MQVKNYALKHQLEVADVLETLASKFQKTVWQPSSELKPTHLDLLEMTFGTSQPKLPATQPQLQLPASELQNSESLTTRPKSDLAKAIADKKDSLATQELERLKVEIKTTVIKESAQIAAIQDYQIFNDTYEETTRDLVVNEVVTHLERQASVREKFKSAQMLRQQIQAKPQSKDLTTELLDLWGNEHNEFVHGLLKNI